MYFLVDNVFTLIRTKPLLNQCHWMVLFVLQTTLLIFHVSVKYVILRTTAAHQPVVTMDNGFQVVRNLKY
jgi:hypothetical protein